MKKILLVFSFLCLFANLAIGQSMTISHSPLSPNDTLWVEPGDTISFHYGGGGPHPMTSGHGSTASPVFFPTVTVNSGTPKAEFTLDSVGTYIFHCGTNPNNTNNWGTIIVMENIGIDELSNTVAIYPNPAYDVINIEDANLMDYEYQIFDVLGNVIEAGTFDESRTQISIQHLPSGTYVLRITGESAVIRTFQKL